MAVFVRTRNHQMRVGVLLQHSTERTGEQIESLDRVDSPKEQHKR